MRSMTTSKLSLEPGAMDDGRGEEGRVVVTEPLASDPLDFGERKPRPWTLGGDGDDPVETTLMATRQDPIASLRRQ